MKIFRKNKRKGEMTQPPHLNLTMSSLGVMSHHQHTKIKKTKSNTRKTKIDKNAHKRRHSPKNTTLTKTTARSHKYTN